MHQIKLHQISTEALHALLQAARPVMLEFEFLFKSIIVYLDGRGGKNLPSARHKL
jgi:hypothetical protein